MTYEEMMKKIGKSVEDIFEEYVHANIYKKWEKKNLFKDTRYIILNAAIKNLQKKRRINQIRTALFLGINRNTLRKISKAVDEMEYDE